ncbi:MAG: acyclic terpene utilization AtuA family protein [Burkholderiaceae bacterium]
MTNSSIRIGAASGFWGDTASAAPQLLAGGPLDFLVFDYLAEVTMSILATQRRRDPAMGYATDFVQVTLRALLPELLQRRVRVVANAGGVNPLACRDAVMALAAELGVSVKVGVVLGDDLTGQADTLANAGYREMFTGEAFPDKVVSINAYLGARPIACALDAGCDIVITGRCVDSAVTLGCLMHAFGWNDEALDLLAQGSLAGHLIECGAQACGGLFTDWEEVPGWDHIGFPVIEAFADGRFQLSKPPGTGGLVRADALAEQMLYEIADPRAYLLPDVCCDFTQVRFEQLGPGCVEVTGARGRPPTDDCKVSVTWMDGFRNAAFLTLVGPHAVLKAERTGEALFARMARMLEQAGLPPFTERRIEVLGSGAMFGPPDRALVAAQREQAMEVVLKMAVRGTERKSLELFAREYAAAGTSMAPGTTGLVGGRPTPTPVVRLFSMLLPKQALTVSVDLDGESIAVPFHLHGGFDPADLPAAIQHGPAAAAAARTGEGQALVTVPLLRLAHGRSGDKGDVANVGIIARSPALTGWLAHVLTADRVAQAFVHRQPRRVERFDLPGCQAMNFVLHGVLGGGGMASLHTDNLAKCYAQVLLSQPIAVPESLLASL